MRRNKNSQLIVGGHQQLLGRLEKHFTAFRKAQPPGTRVPDDLRVAVLDAVDAGVSAAAIGRVCGVTGGQLGQWRAWRRLAGEPRPKGSGDPQILTVVDSQVGKTGAEDVALDVGIGTWRLSILLRPNDVAGR